MDFMPFLTQFLNNLLPPLGAALGVAVFVVCAQYIRLLQVKIQEANPVLFDQLKKFAELAVLAAEAAGAANLIASKKQYAIDIVQAWLEESGFGDVDFKLIADAIEAAILTEIKAPGKVELKRVMKG